MYSICGAYPPIYSYVSSPPMSSSDKIGDIVCVEGRLESSSWTKLKRDGTSIPSARHSSSAMTDMLSADVCILRINSRAPSSYLCQIIGFGGKCPCTY